VFISSLFDNNIQKEKNMATKPVVEGLVPPASQLKELFRQIDDGSLNSLDLQAFLEHRNPFGVDNILIDWKKVYEILDIQADFNNADMNDRNYWIVPVDKGLTIEKVADALFDLGVYIDSEPLTLEEGELAKYAGVNDRWSTTVQGYRVKFYKTIESDVALKNKSANDLKKQGIDGITFLERLLLELGYFLTTRKHLDVEGINATLCSGSRSIEGSVPYIRYSTIGKKIFVYLANPSNSSEYIRARAVIP
jgi:hypothetical protein